MSHLHFRPENSKKRGMLYFSKKDAKVFLEWVTEMKELELEEPVR
jgi:hypothetical protein